MEQIFPRDLVMATALTSEQVGSMDISILMQSLEHFVYYLWVSLSNYRSCVDLCHLAHFLQCRSINGFEWLRLTVLELSYMEPNRPAPIFMWRLWRASIDSQQHGVVYGLFCPPPSSGPSNQNCSREQDGGRWFCCCWMFCSTKTPVLRKCNYKCVCRANIFVHFHVPV